MRLSYHTESRTADGVYLLYEQTLFNKPINDGELLSLSPRSFICPQGFAYGVCPHLDVWERSWGDPCYSGTGESRMAKEERNRNPAHDFNYNTGLEDAIDEVVLPRLSLPCPSVTLHCPDCGTDCEVRSDRDEHGMVFSLSLRAWSVMGSDDASLTWQYWAWHSRTYFINYGYPRYKIKCSELLAPGDARRLWKESGGSDEAEWEAGPVPSSE